MRNLSSLGVAVGVTAALTLLAGCSAGGSQAPAAGAFGVRGIAATQSLTASMKPFVNVAAVNAPGGNQVIISTASADTVTIYGGAGQINANLTRANGLHTPEGIATDSSGTLYVANATASNVLVFTKPYNAAPSILSDAGQFPLDVSYDASSGNVGVTNIASASGGPGSVSIYRRGSSRACATVGNPNWASVIYGAFDKFGNLYVDGRDTSNGTTTGIVRGGCSATTIETLTNGFSLVYPGGIVVAKNGHILIDNVDGSNSKIFTYAPASHGSLGSPIATTPLTGAKEPTTIALKAGGENLWTSDELAGGAEFTYPAGGSVIDSLIDPYGNPSGIAVNPAEVP